MGAPGDDRGFPFLPALPWDIEISAAEARAVDWTSPAVLPLDQFAWTGGGGATLATTATTATA